MSLVLYNNMLLFFDNNMLLDLQGSAVLGPAVEGRERG